MGLNKLNMQRFLERVDDSLEDLFPATVVIGGTSYAASGVGGSALNTYLAGGQAEQGQRIFRVSKATLTTRPSVGDALTWSDATGPVTAFRILEVPDRPHETSWFLRCEPAQR